MENMDATVIATSLPAIAADIGTSPIALKLAFTAYFVALAIFIPISAWAADKFGAKTVFRVAIVVFVMGSVACALSGSLLEFVLARFVKGIGGAMMSPIARLILFRSVARRDLVSAMAWLTIPALVAPMIGPPLGGFVTTFVSWHWIFLINVPIGIVGLIMVTLFLPEMPSEPERRHMDFPGFLLLGIAFSGIVFGVSLLSLPILPLWVAIVSTVLGIVAGIVYFPYARRVRQPLIDLALFAEPVFRASIISSSIFLIGVGAIPFLFPLMLQLGFGMTPFESGVITFIGAVGAIVMKFFAKRLYAAIGFRTALTAAAFLTAAGIAVKGSLDAQTPIAIILALLFFNGIIRAVYFTGYNALLLSEIPDPQVGQATAISAVTRPIFTALGVALAGGVLELSARQHGGEPLLGDFQTAFFIVGAVSAFAALPLLFGLQRNSGNLVSGHGMAPTAERQLEPHV